MTSSQLLSIITFVYCAAAFAYLASWVFKKDTPGKVGTFLAIVAVVGNLAGLLLRWRESYTLGIGHAPLSNLYESLMFFALTTGVLYLYLERKYKNRVIGGFAMPLAFLAMAYASMSPAISDRIQPLIPALKSNWLIAHVIACFIGYAAFAIAFGISIMYLLGNGRGDNGGTQEGLLQRLPSAKVLDELTHQLVMFGFLWLSAGIITGAVWANSAWGRYWGWDPKETWSFITWLIYAALLHFRLMRGWRGKRIAVLSVVGFLAVMFTYFGVNLLPGLHSYGAMGG
jgi:cytochrome c-type biogenesis protein CcsB